MKIEETQCEHMKTILNQRGIIKNKMTRIKHETIRKHNYNTWKSEIIYGVIQNHKEIIWKTMKIREILNTMNQCKQKIMRIHENRFAHENQFQHSAHGTVTPAVCWSVLGQILHQQQWKQHFDLKNFHFFGGFTKKPSGDRKTPVGIVYRGFLCSPNANGK